MATPHRTEACRPQGRHLRAALQATGSMNGFLPLLRPRHAGAMRTRTDKACNRRPGRVQACRRQYLKTGIFIPVPQAAHRCGAAARETRRQRYKCRRTQHTPRPCTPRPHTANRVFSSSTAVRPRLLGKRLISLSAVAAKKSCSGIKQLQRPCCLPAKHLG